MLKMSSKIYFSFLLLSVCFSFGQVNLVPNPSFEDTLGCPQGYPDLDTKCNNWKSFRATPDYMNNCSSMCGYYNQYGFQQPHSGTAYAGFASYQTTLPNAREHIGVQLTSPLTIGTKYYISFFASPAFNVQANVATNKLGAFLTTYLYSDPNGTFSLPNTCKVKTDSIVKDSINWTKVSGSFVSDSSYQYMVIGNFFDDNNIDTSHFKNLGFGYYLSYYYLDDVCITTDSLYNESWTNILANKDHSWIAEVYPNPSSEILNVKANQVIDQVQIISPMGQKIVEIRINKNFCSFSIADIPNGIYFLKVKIKNYFSNSIIHISH